jgi:beta-phosphoglucomutase-like phosphatase (HAD superfamily)
MSIDLPHSGKQAMVPEIQKMMDELFSRSMASMSRRDRRKVERSMKKASLKK